VALITTAWFILWVSKHLPAMEMSAYSAETMTLKIACELVVALHYKLCMLGVPIDGPANGFVDGKFLRKMMMP